MKTQAAEQPYSEKEVFRFKRFDVANRRSAMKVNTDGVLLGAVTEVLESDLNILDIGTGTGTVALMLAQRREEASGAAAGLAGIDDGWRIQGIDIDPDSAAEAAENFRNSPWNSHLAALNLSLRRFADHPAAGGGLDLIVSNPPYYDNSLQAPERRRNTARHTGDPESPAGCEPLSYREILEYASSALSQDGRVSIVLPADQESALLRHARMCGFLPWKILRIKTVERKPVSRVIVRFKRRVAAPSVPEEETLTLLDGEGRRTGRHASLVEDFYLW